MKNDVRSYLILCENCYCILNIVFIESVLLEIPVFVKYTAVVSYNNIIWMLSSW